MKHKKFYNDGVLTLEEFEFLLYQSPYVNGSELIARRKNYDQYATEVFGIDNICT